MSQTVAIPQSNYKGPLDAVISDPYEVNVGKRRMLDFWGEQMDKLASKRISWEQFFDLLPKEFLSRPNHPVVEASTSIGGNGLLHIAVYQNRKDFITPLSRIASLRLKRNALGLTPIELARYLDHKEAVELIKPGRLITFGTQPNVQIEEGERAERLNAIEFLPHPIYECEETLNCILTRTRKAKAADQIPPEKIWLGVYFDHELENGLHPKVAIRWIDEEIGFGVFAQQRISPASFVGEYTGVVEERKTKHLKDNYYCVRYTTWEMGRKKFVVDAQNKGNFTRYINHSFKPNLGLQSIYWNGLPRMIFISLAEIAVGTQLTFDYGSFFWKECQQAPKIV